MHNVVTHNVVAFFITRVYVFLSLLLVSLSGCFSSLLFFLPRVRAVRRGLERADNKGSAAAAAAAR